MHGFPIMSPKLQRRDTQPAGHPRARERGFRGSPFQQKANGEGDRLVGMEESK